MIDGRDLIRVHDEMKRRRWAPRGATVSDGPNDPPPRAVEGGE